MIFPKSLQPFCFADLGSGSCSQADRTATYISALVGAAMSRGLFILVLQLGVSIGVAGIGAWAVLLPQHLQNFINLNFALLPACRPGSFITPTLIRAAGVCLMLYSYMLALNFKDELLWLGAAFGVV